MEATVAACRCAKSGGLFGVRFEKRNNTWVYNWSFKLSEATVQHEGYDSIEIRGRVTLDPDYPGCPYCETKSLLVCSCGKLNCYDGKSRTTTCRWCGVSGNVDGGPVKIQTSGNL